MQTTSQDYAQLRGKGLGPDASGGIDGSDNFMMGHRVCGPRRPRRPVPEWAVNPEQIAKLLLQMFPKMNDEVVIFKHKPLSSNSQHFRATVYAYVIQLYYRMNLTAREIEEEMLERYGEGRGQRAGSKMFGRGRVNRILKDIRRAAAGRRRDNGKPLLTREEKKRPGPKPKPKSFILTALN